MKATFTTLWLPLAALGLTTACGDRDEREKTPQEESAADDAGDGDGDNVDTSELLTDDEVASQTIAAQIDEGIAGAVEDQDDNPAMSLVAAAAAGEVKRFRECNVVDDTAVVDITRSAERTITLDGIKRSGESKFSAYETKQRLWSREGGTVACSDNGKFAAIAPADLAGVSLAVTFERERARSQSFTNKKTGVAFSRSAKHVVKGSRQIDWTSVTPEGAGLLLEKTVAGSSERTLTVTDKAGETRTLTGTLATAESAPLVVLVKRDANLAVESRTIKSGTVIGVGADGGRVETTFAGVVYNRGDGCIASAGKISGAIYEKDATTATATFEIDLDGETKSIKLSTGAEFEYAPEGCDLDDPSPAVEADASADVVKPDAP